MFETSMSAEYFKPKLSAHVENDFDYKNIQTVCLFYRFYCKFNSHKKILQLFFLHLSVVTQKISHASILSLSTADLQNSGNLNYLFLTAS